MSFGPEHSIPSIRVPLAIQLLAWGLGIVACLAGMLNLIAEWDPNLASVQFFILVVAPILWMIERKPASRSSTETLPDADDRNAYVVAVLVALTSLATCFAVGYDMVDLPPAYHDEYSYVFEAKILLSGAFSVPSHPTHPELFDQMHVLNEGRMASRYYPGTGLWLAPWIAIGHPYWGQWLAASLASVFVFWTGYELGRLRVAVVSGFACALSPGIAIFANLLLAHQATLLGLTLFIWAFVKWQRTLSLRELFFAGCGLSFAMLCRPATAASVGFPFGVALILRLVFARDIERAAVWRFRRNCLLAIGLPLVAGWIVMLAYNKDVTGSWTTSPYQLYTDLYTPRHVFGFNNVIRGEQTLGPKVIDAYDRWATNLTPELAVLNVRDRLLTSWLWTFDLLSFLMTTVVVIGTIGRWSYRWGCIGLAILSLHAMHVPYWYAGIMGWHYVFESAALWCLLLGLATDVLIGDWRACRRWMMPGWWYFLLIASIAGAYCLIGLPNVSPFISPRISKATGSIMFPRRRYADFDQRLKATIKDRPAIVLILTDPDDQHVDYATTSPFLDDEILRARYRTGEASAVVDSFPDRHVYVVDPKRMTIEKLK